MLAWRKVAGFRGDSSFKTWLLTIVWRQALDRRRSRDRWWRRRETTAATSAQAWTDGLDHLATPDADPARLAEGRARLAHVGRSIAALSPKLGITAQEARQDPRIVAQAPEQPLAERARIAEDGRG